MISELPTWVGALASAVAGGLLLIIGQAITQRWKERNVTAPTWPEMWARIDAQDARIDKLESELKTERLKNDRERKIVGGILTQLLDQWPNDKLPDMHAAQLEYMETIIPEPLFSKLRPRSA